MEGKKDYIRNNIRANKKVLQGLKRKKKRNKTIHNTIYYLYNLLEKAILNPTTYGIYTD